MNTRATGVKNQVYYNLVMLLTVYRNFWLDHVKRFRKIENNQIPTNHAVSIEIKW